MTWYGAAIGRDRGVLQPINYCSPDNQHVYGNKCPCYGVIFCSLRGIYLRLIAMSRKMMLINSCQSSESFTDVVRIDEEAFKCSFQLVYSEAELSLSPGRSNIWCGTEMVAGSDWSWSPGLRWALSNGRSSSSWKSSSYHQLWRLIHHSLMRHKIDAMSKMINSPRLKYTYNLLIVSHPYYGQDTRCVLIKIFFCKK